MSISDTTSGFLLRTAKKYSTGAFLLSLPKVVAIVVGLITFPIILANLTVEDYGIFQFALAVEFWLTTSSAFNTTLGAKRGIANGMDGTFLFAFLFRLKLLALLSIGVLFAAFVMSQFGMTILSALLVIVAVYIVFGHLPHTSYPEFLIAKKNFKAYAFWQVLVRILVPILSMITAILTQNIFWFTLVYLGISTLLGWFGWLYVMLRYKVLASFRAGHIDKACVPYGIKLVPALIIANTANRAADFLIGPFFGFANLAVFSVARNLERYSRTPTKILHNLLYSDFANKGHAALIEQVRRRLPIIFLGSLVFVFFTAFAGYGYISLLLPAAYQGAIFYFILLLIGLPAEVMTVFLSTILSVNLRHRELSWLIIAPNLLRILLIGAFGFLFGITGIVLAIIVGSWITLLLHYVITMRFQKINILHE